MVGLYYAYHLCRVDFQCWHTGTVACLVDRYLATVRRIEWYIHIVQAENLRIESLIKLNNHLLGHSCVGWGIAQAGTEYYLAVVADALHLKDSHIELPESAVAQLLRDFREVKVEVVCCVAVGSLAHVGARLVGGAHVDGIGTGKFSIDKVVGRCSCEHVDFEFAAFLMLFLGNCGKSHGHIFRRTACGEARKAHIEAILDVQGGFVCR